MNTESLLDKLTKAISFKYSEDKTSPGITVALLKKGYYCSVVRYEDAFAKNKKVVCHATANTLDATLKAVASKFLLLNKATKDPVQELDELIKGV